jgi:hypothetical protein
MMKRIFIFTVFSIGILLIVASQSQAQQVASPMVDRTAWWLLADSRPDARSKQDFDALVKVLIDRGKVPPDQIHRIAGAECTRDGVHTAIRGLARGIKKDDRLIFLLRGFVTKPALSNSIYFLIHGATSENLATALEDKQLNRWLRETGEAEAIVLFDGYTTDQNLYAYLANRAILGDAALVSIQPSANANAIATDVFLERLLSGLGADASDLNDNRQFSVDELSQHLTAEPMGQDGISAPMGNVDAALLKLSPMLKIVTSPDGAAVSLNGKAIGNTPQRLIDTLERGTYEIDVKKPGYLIPPSRSVQVKRTRGEGVEVSWTLEPIAVYGTVSPPAGKTLESAKVWIQDTSYQQVVGADGEYRFADQKAEGILAIGKAYTLRAEGGERFHAESTFTFDGHESIQQKLSLAEKTWFEVAQIRIDRDDDEGAIAAFQNGIELTTEIPPLSTELTVLLFNSFSAAVDEMNIENVNYVVAAATLADRFGDEKRAKTYWGQVKSKAAKRTSEHKLASKRLWQLNWGRYLINIALAILVIVVLISGGYTLIKQRRAKG